jgi:hypothetical protein
MVERSDLYTLLNTPEITSKEYKMEKYGFVYIWFDRKHKRYYIGCRWGHENDGYVCSSPWMKQGYKYRPEDFKRKILSRINTNKKDLLEEEYRWLYKIKNSELGKRYYNLHNHHFGHWSINESSKLTIGQKISESHKKDPNWGKWNRGKKVHNEQSKQKLREANQRQFQDFDQIELRKQKSKELWSNPEYLEKQKNARSKPGFYKGNNKPHSDVTKKLISEKKLGVSVHDEESRFKISKAFSNMIWITDGKSNRRINNDIDIPVGYRKGRIKKFKV